MGNEKRLHTVPLTSCNLFFSSFFDSPCCVFFLLLPFHLHSQYLLRTVKHIEVSVSSFKLWYYCTYLFLSKYMRPNWVTKKQRGFTTPLEWLPYNGSEKCLRGKSPRESKREKKGDVEFQRRGIEWGFTRAEITGGEMRWRQKRQGREEEQGVIVKQGKGCDVPIDSFPVALSHPSDKWFKKRSSDCHIHKNISESGR